MPSKKEIKKRIKEIIDDECVILKNKIKGRDWLEDDLDLDDDDFKDIKNAINDEYDISLKKKHIKRCIDVNDIVDLVYDELNQDDDRQISDEDQKRIRKYMEHEEISAQKAAQASKDDFIDWLVGLGLTFLAKKLMGWAWTKIVPWLF